MVVVTGSKLSGFLLFIIIFYLLLLFFYYSDTGLSNKSTVLILRKQLHTNGIWCTLGNIHTFLQQQNSSSSPFFTSKIVLIRSKIIVIA